MNNNKNTDRQAALANGDEIENLPVVGKNWYNHNANYWSRRIVYSLLMAIAVAIETAVLFGIWEAIIGTAGHIIFLVIEGGLSIYTGVVIFQGMRKSAMKKPPSSKNTKRAGVFGASIGILARVLTVFGAIFIVLGSVLTYGLILVLFIRSFLPELDTERQARMRLNEKARLKE